MGKWQRLVALMGFALMGCGVKGLPRAPATPPELGRGQPTFKRATQQFTFPNVPPAEDAPAEPRSREGDE